MSAPRGSGQPTTGAASLPRGWAQQLNLTFKECHLMQNTIQRTDGAALDVRALRARLVGELVLPGEDGWDAARQAWNLAVDQRPAAVVLAETAEDVVATVDFAREHGLRVAPQGTGHNAGPLELENTVLLKTERMRRVRIDPDGRRARVEAGTLWAELTEVASRHGLVGLAGSSPDVGVVGYALGGGVSWLARKHGLAANSVLAVELVTADGRLLRVDAEHEPELFWAVRGGGGNFGVVTALELRLFPIAEVYAGWLVFPVERSAEVLHAWREWIRTVPDEVTSVGRILNLPPIPDIPEPLRGRSIAVVEATFLTGEAEASALLAPLRALGPELDTFATMPASQLHHLHMDPPEPVPGAGDGTMLAAFPAEAVDAFVAGAAGSPLLSTEIRHLGGALSVARPEHGALASLEADFAVFAVGMATTPELGAAVKAAAERILAALAPWNAEQTYLNFTERREDARGFFTPFAYRRLREVKARVDPDALIRANHPIPPAAAPAAGRRRISRPVRARA
jgi:FAD/FMN-containing dehydrogenase